MKYLNLSGLNASVVSQAPFPHLVTKDFIVEKHLNEVLDVYPLVPGTGSYPSSLLKIHPIFQTLLDEFHSQELRIIMENKFDINLYKKPVMITARGYCHPKDGKIHLDNRHKLLTLLLYMNPVWPSQDGQLRLLRNSHDLSNPAIEIPPLAGTLVVFKPTKNAWHGHTTFDGPRRAIQINYIDSHLILMKEKMRHHLASAIKKLRKNLRKADSIESSSP